MTDERKAEVNRRLAEFEWKHFNEVKLDWRTGNGPNYTADLNALARLETKLPRLHAWEIWDIITGKISVELQFHKDFNAYACTEPTEAEARAEAICLYLESQVKNES